jgi:hypothetical protein
MQINTDAKHRSPLKIKPNEFPCPLNTTFKCSVENAELEAVPLIDYLRTGLLVS